MPDRTQKGVIIWLLVIILMIIASPSFAEIKVFEREYTYQASEVDSKLSSRTISLAEVKRLLLEELGTYLESITEVKNFQLTRDQITTLTAGIVRVEIVDERWDGKTYWLKARIAADPNDVIKSIDALRKDRQKTKELEEIKKRADALLKENERLKDELKTAEGRTKGKIQEEYVQGIKALNAVEWVQRGVSLDESGNYNEAMEAFTNAIELDPKLARAYVARGVAYANLGNNQQAIKDFDRAIELDPKDEKAYNNRGVAYANLGDYQQAIRDLDRAIELDPKLAAAYHSRGTVYFMLGNTQQAIRDYDRAIEIDPKNAEAYYNRGLVYVMLGNYQQAIKDFKIAARLGLKDAQDLLREKGYDW